MSCGSTADSVDFARKSVSIKNAAGEKVVPYDRLIVATGATPMRPNFPGGALDGVFSLQDGVRVRCSIVELSPTPLPAKSLEK
jgi:NADH dehydrogenase FAD-containing subunit